MHELQIACVTFMIDFDLYLQSCRVTHRNEGKAKLNYEVKLMTGS